MDLDTFESIKERLNFGTVGKPALIGIVFVLVLVAVLAAGRFSGAATASEFQVSRAAESASSVVASGEATSSSAQPSTLFVHVSGAVIAPGLCEVEAGARVADAVQAAGGFSDDAQTDSVNLARQVADGEQIVVAYRADATQGAAGSAQAADAAPSAPAPGGAAGAQTVAGAYGGRVNINTATADDLVSLPGIGEATADKIVTDRQANGAFASVEDLKRVSGIGDRKFEALKDLICV